MNKKEQDQNYARIERELMKRRKKLARWCRFDDFIYHVEHWSNYDYATAQIEVYDDRHYKRWMAYLKVYDGDRMPHELRVVSGASDTVKTGSIERFDSLDKLFDRAEELRQDCVRYLYAKSRETELEEILEVL